LLLKIGLFAIVVAIGGYNRFILMPAIGERSPQDLLLRNVVMETVLLIGVLGVTALLSNTPPAHHY
jgi:putative copper export protein